MRPKRDFRPRGLYGITQRGNQGQWVYRDDEDFERALEYMRKYSEMHAVVVHGYVLMHNHGHWLFEASTAESISNLMRDMQSRFSRYLNRKYERMPWVLVGPLAGLTWEDLAAFSPYRRTGPVNWTPRFHSSDELDEIGFKQFLEYLENNPVRAYLAPHAMEWTWSSAPVHCGIEVAADSLVCTERWREIFGRPAAIVEEWREYLASEILAERRNAALLRRYARGLRRGRFGTGSGWNRPVGWSGALASAG